MADVTISMTIPGAQVQRVIAAFCAMYGYKEVLSNPDGSETPNPETKAAFTKRMVQQYLKEVVKGYEAQLAAKTAQQDVVNNFSLDLT